MKKVELVKQFYDELPILYSDIESEVRSWSIGFGAIICGFFDVESNPPTIDQEGSIFSILDMNNRSILFSKYGKGRKCYAANDSEAVELTVSKLNINGKFYYVVPFWPIFSNTRIGKQCLVVVAMFDSEFQFQELYEDEVNFVSRKSLENNPKYWRHSDSELRPFLL